jgi:hypothetical protein
MVGDGMRAGGHVSPGHGSRSPVVNSPGINCAVANNNAN